MGMKFYLFSLSSWTEDVPGNFFELTDGPERLIGSTPGIAGSELTFNGYQDAVLVEVEGEIVRDNGNGAGTLVGEYELDGETYDFTDGEVEMDLGFVVVDPRVRTH